MTTAVVVTDHERRYQLRTKYGIIQTQRLGIAMEHLFLFLASRWDSSARQVVSHGIFSTKNETFLFSSSPRA